MSTILITGGTGLIGKALTKLLVENDYDVIILSRTTKRSRENNVTYALWDLEKKTIEEKAISSADYIIHLAGAGVAEKRWTASRKKEIVESRIESSGLLVKALQNTPNKVKAVISASATGWYGSDKKTTSKPRLFTEEQPAAKDFLGETCRLWEQSIEPVTALGKRLVKIRTGIVLANEGGALPEFKKPVKFGVAAILGDGDQMIPWIHIDDLCRMYLYAIQHEELNGAYNAVATIPATNKTLTTLVARKMKRNFFVAIHVPAVILKLMIGQMSIEVLKSVTVSSNKIREAGFTFIYPSIELALSNLMKG